MDFQAPGSILAEPSRGRRFVGRSVERQLFLAALDGPAAVRPVLFAYGPGGVGKTSLLAVLRETAERRGAAVVRVDGREVAPSEAVVRAALRDLLEPAPDPAGGPAPGPAGRCVLLLDTYERLAPLDDWLRDWLLPQLPAGTVTVIAGRIPPGPGWRTDPAWRELLQVVPLRNFTPEESHHYLDERGIPAAAQDRLATLSHGHPLSLGLLAEVVARGGGGQVDPPDPDLVGTLVRQFVDTLPDQLQRQVLGVCAMARETTEPLLRGALELAPDRAHELFGWLQNLSFVESAGAGVQPHELARDVLDVDLRWRDQASYEATFRRVRRQLHRRLAVTRGEAQQNAIYDEKYLFRNLPSILSPLDWGRWGWHRPEPARPADHGAILGLVQAWEGPASAAIAERWLDRQPAGFFVLRREGGAVSGLLGLLDLTMASAADRAADPGAAAAWEFAQRHAPVRLGESLLQSRFIIDREHYQGPSATLNAAPVLTIQRYLQAPRLAWDFLTLAEPERWDPYFAAVDLPRAAGADFLLDGRRFGLFAHDFRQVPVDDWMALVTERALEQDFTLPPRNPPEVLALSRVELAAAVARALPGLSRREQLGRSPLLRSRALSAHAGSESPEAADLADLLADAAAALREHPDGEPLFRAVELTYLRPAGSEPAAAASLGLPVETYRHYLQQAVARIVAWLWGRDTPGATR